MKIRTIRLLAREGVSNVVKNKLMSLASLFMVLVAILLLGFVLLLAINVGQIMQSVREEPEILVTLKTDISAFDRAAITLFIEERKASGEIASFVYIDKEANFEAWKKVVTDPALWKGMTAEVLPEFFEIKLSDPEKREAFIKPLSRMSGLYQTAVPIGSDSPSASDHPTGMDSSSGLTGSAISGSSSDSFSSTASGDEVDSNGSSAAGDEVEPNGSSASEGLSVSGGITFPNDDYMRLTSFADMLNKVTLGLMAIMLIISVFIISNTIRLTVLARNREIEIMRSVGALDSFIRLPFFVEGITIGIVGALVSFLLTMKAYDWAVGFLNPQLVDAGYALAQLIPFAPIALRVLAIYAIIGMSVGGIGSLISVRKYLKV